MRRFANDSHKQGKTIRPHLVLPLVLFVIIVAIIIILIVHKQIDNNSSLSIVTRKELSSLSYEGEIAVEVNSNQPFFSEEDIQRAAEGGFERYSELDSLERCGVSEASVCIDTMPHDGEKRTSMGAVFPSGWQSISFWCRCHLIGWQLTGENANEKNLITGTTRMNMSGMLPYENSIARYIEENPNNHVLYRVEPLFVGDNLIASGINLQAESVEDKGKSIRFNVYVFNCQPGYIINYKDGTVEDDPEHQTTITIADKRARFTGEPIQIDAAKIEGSTGDVRYIYYTDADAKTKTTEADGADRNGAAPSFRGRYFARAVVSGDNWYPTAASNVAELVIY